MGHCHRKHSAAGESWLLVLKPHDTTLKCAQNRTQHDVPHKDGTMWRPVTSSVVVRRVCVCVCAGPHPTQRRRRQPMHSMGRHDDDDTPPLRDHTSTQAHAYLVLVCGILYIHTYNTGFMFVASSSELRVALSGFRRGTP